MRWEMLTSSELLAKKGSWVIVPVAQIEGHGKLLPVGADKYIVEHISKEAASRLDALVGPTIHFGNCIDFEGWFGYITVENSTFLQLIKDYTNSLLRQDFKRIAFLVNHGGHNYNGIDLALDGMRLGDGVHIILVSTAMLAPKMTARWRELGAEPDMSATMALHSDLVNKELLKQYPPPGDYSNLRSRIGRHYGAGFAPGKIIPEGVPLTFPNSSPELGRQFLDECIATLVSLMKS